MGSDRWKRGGHTHGTDRRLQLPPRAKKVGLCGWGRWGRWDGWGGVRREVSESRREREREREREIGEQGCVGEII